jgi:hypothetical protein
MAFLAAPAAAERQLVLASCALSVCEVVVVSAIATFFASFSSPFLTGIFTLGVFILGRSTDTLANLPVRVVGSTMKSAGLALARVLPNLHLYVPPRPLLLGQVSDQPTWAFVANAGAIAVLYAVLILAVSVVIFRKRDFQ